MRLPKNREPQLTLAAPTLCTSSRIIQNDAFLSWRCCGGKHAAWALSRSPRLYQLSIRHTQTHLLPLRVGGLPCDAERGGWTSGGHADCAGCGVRRCRVVPVDVVRGAATVRCVAAGVGRAVLDNLSTARLRRGSAVTTCGSGGLHRGLGPAVTVAHGHSQRAAAAATTGPIGWLCSRRGHDATRAAQ